MVHKGVQNLQKMPFAEISEVSKEGRHPTRRVRNPWYTPRGKRVAERLMASFERTAANIKLRRQLSPGVEERMCRYSVLFAYLDWIGRSPYGNSATERMMLLAGSTVTYMLREVDTAIVADVQTLSRMFVERQQLLIKNANKIVLGRALDGSADVIGGADFDLIIDGCLLELKTSLRPKVTTDILRQLVGYWLLDYDDKYHIDTVGVLLMRHGHLQHFNVRELLGTSIPPEVLRAEFRDGIRRDKAERMAQFEAWFAARFGPGNPSD